MKLKLSPRRWANQVLNAFGYDLAKLERSALFRDIKRFLPDRDNLMVFDVGANLGQTALKFKKAFRRCTVHSFEPGAAAFAKLKGNVADSGNVFAWNLALGATPGRQTFFENTRSEMSSFLPLGERSWGRVEKETVVTVATIDQFCAEHQIERIDILKTDTQGYDLEVFKGAEAMMEKGKISLIFFEVNFSEMYKGAPPFEEIFHYLNRHGFQLERLYGISHFTQAIWTDALFVHKRYLAK